MVMVAVPFAFAAVVQVSVQVVLTCLDILNIDVLLLPTILKCTVCAPSFGPALIAVAQFVIDCAPASSRTVWSARSEERRVGKKCVTLMATVCATEVSIPPLAVPPLAERVTVMVAET